MLIGILSDTHGDTHRTAHALAIFRSLGAGAILHCGDIGSTGVLAELATSEVPVHAVLGNVDLYDPDIEAFPATTRVVMHGRFADLVIDGHRIAIAHGDDALILRRAIISGDFEYVFTGHTHEARDDRVGPTRVINPGAVHRANPPGVATLDLVSGTLHFHRIPRD